MLALLSLLDLVYMLGSMLAATLLKIVALPVPLLRQVSKWITEALADVLLFKELDYCWHNLATWIADSVSREVVPRGAIS